MQQNPELSERVELIKAWIEKHADIITTTNSCRVQLNLKGTSVKGEVVLLPDSE